MSSNKKSEYDLEAPSLEGVLMQLRNTFIDFAPQVSSAVPRAATMPNISELYDATDSPRSDLLFDALRSFHPSVFQSLVQEEVGSPRSSMLPTPVDTIVEVPSPASPSQASLRAVASLTNMQNLLQKVASTFPRVCSTGSIAASEDESSVFALPKGQVIYPESNGETTVMLRNLPNKLTQMDIIRCLYEKGFEGKFNFFYSPLDFKSQCNLGYAFINMLDADEAVRLWITLKGHRLVSSTAVDGPALKSSKLTEVSWARIQGLQANVKHYINSPVNALPEEFRPMLVEPSTGRITPFSEANPRSNNSTHHHNNNAGYQLYDNRPRDFNKLGPYLSNYRDHNSTNQNHHQTNQSHHHQSHHHQSTNSQNTTPHSQTNFYSNHTPVHKDRKPQSKLSDDRKLFCGGLSVETTSVSLLDHFQKFGEVEEAVVLISKDTGISRGFGFCTFKHINSIHKALSINEHSIDGVNIAVRLYSPPKAL